MNADEIQALQQSLSNDARVLYCLYLRPTANQTTGLTAQLEYKSILTLLNSKEQKFERGRQVNRLIKELIQFDLVTLLPEQDVECSLNHCCVLLPKLSNAVSFASLYEQAKPISSQWTPNEALLTELMTLIGIIDTQVNPDDIGEFIAYWQGRPDIRLTEYQWTQRLAQQLKRNKTASGMINVKRVGSQIVATESGIETDDNTKRLLEKYPNSNKTTG